MANQFDVGFNVVNGMVSADVRVDPKTKLSEISKVLTQITSNKELMQKLGLKGCTACKSGIDFKIRNRFDHVIKIGL